MTKNKVKAVVETWETCQYINLTEDEIRDCAEGECGEFDDLSVQWEHNEWWVTNLVTGAQWSVHLCSGPRGLDF